MSQSQHWIATAGQPLRGTLEIPGDKSVSHRSVMLAALADGVSTIDGFLEGEDTRATAAIFARLGVRIETPSPSRRIVHGVGVDGLKAGAGDPKEKAAPAGMKMGKNDFGIAAYGGPCPPAGGGVHRYQIVVHALRVAKLPEGAGTTAAMTGFMINGVQIGQAQLTLKYGR